VRRVPGRRRRSQKGAYVAMLHLVPVRLARRRDRPPSDEEIATAAQAAADVFLRAYALELPAARKTRKRRSSR
jgi:hypothetical protein